MLILKAGVLYFGLVFGVGFVLGTIHMLWVVSRVGTRMAELMETPIMLVVTIVTARLLVLRLAVPSTPSAGLGMGCIALALLLVAEFGFVLWLRGLSIREYLATRDPVSGTVYYVMVFGSPVCQLCARLGNHSARDRACCTISTNTPRVSAGLLTSGVQEARGRSFKQSAFVSTRIGESAVPHFN